MAASGMWDTVDLSPYDKDNTDRAKIEAGKAVPCRLCENAFRRLRLTLRYCAQCGVGFCEGEHGNFSTQTRARCVQCGPHASSL
jgi:hypothetical protein